MTLFWSSERSCTPKVREIARASSSMSIEFKTKPILEQRALRIDRIRRDLKVEGLHDELCQVGFVGGLGSELRHRWFHCSHEFISARRGGMALRAAMLQPFSTRRHGGGPPAAEAVRGNFRASARDTDYLLPPSLDEWLPQQHLARLAVKVIDGLDRSALIRSYRGTGSASYHPVLLLGVVVYGYATGVQLQAGARDV